MRIPPPTHRSLKGVTHLFSNTRETTSFPALVHWLGDPVDSRVSTNLITISREVNNIGYCLPPCD